MPQGGDLAINAGRSRRHIRARWAWPPRTEWSYIEHAEAMAVARTSRSLLGTGPELSTPDFDELESELFDLSKDSVECGLVR